MIIKKLKKILQSLNLLTNEVDQVTNYLSAVSFLLLEAVLISFIIKFLLIYEFKFSIFLIFTFITILFFYFTLFKKKTRLIDGKTQNRCKFSK